MSLEQVNSVFRMKIFINNDSTAQIYSLLIVNYAIKINDNNFDTNNDGNDS